ncbi:DUF1467 family protein [Sphingobium boeckii]|uniref:Putative secreted protein n=1 Tax=Sphingobium boeckii TaxID=1082345 RepID=A0A7W9EEK7_9SPHN|nr:DUF1467 family protein [Sphingobium boeckii]MBB5685100.1 putative secreted protein [Sphingobium boeckii]
MSLSSILAIYLLFWVMTAFVVMPFGVRTHDEAGLPKIPGQADSAPANFRPKRVALITTILSAAAFGLFYANYVNGWIGVEAFDFFKG